MLHQQLWAYARAAAWCTWIERPARQPCNLSCLEVNAQLLASWTNRYERINTMMHQQPELAACTNHCQVHASIQLRRARARMAHHEQRINLLLKVARGEAPDEAQLGLRAPWLDGENGVRETLTSTNMCHWQTQFSQPHDETACPAELWDWFVIRGAHRSRSPSPSLSQSSGCSSGSRSPSLSPSSGSSCSGSEFEGSTPSPRPSPTPTYCALM